MANTYTNLLKLRLPALGDVGWDDEVNDNTQIMEVLLAGILNGNLVNNGCAPSDGGGLQVDYAAGTVYVAGTKRAIGASNKSCTAQVKNWLYVNDSGTVAISSTVPTGDYVILAMIDTSTDDILRIADLRFIMEDLMIKTLEMSGGGTSINEISTDGTLEDNSDDAVPTEKAVRTFVEARPYVKVSEVQASGVNGGTFTQDAWRTRVINTEDSDDAGICSIAANQITLAAGTYISRISAIAMGVDEHKARLYNISDAAVELIGSSQFNASAAHINNAPSVIVGQFTIAAQKIFEVQHYCLLTKNTTGFGDASAIPGTDEVYTVAEFWRV